VSQLNSAEDTTWRPQAEHSRVGLWSTLFIAGLFSAVSLLSSPFPGVNEPHYLAKARSFVDPTWCARDFFLTSANAHYCFFWLVGQLTQWLSFVRSRLPVEFSRRQCWRLAGVCSAVQSIATCFLGCECSDVCLAEFARELFGGMVAGGI
jgi:hypothetical protein